MLGRVAVNHLGEAEVGDLVNAIIDEDVGRLQVAVDDPVPLELLEPVDDLAEDLKG